MASFGSLLRKARDSKRISIDDVARETRLAKHYLQALEGESLSTLPGGAYNRSYLRTYATYLGLDANRLVQKYEEEEARQTAAGRLSARPDALETLRQAAARRVGVPGLVSRALESVSGTAGRVAGSVAVATVLVALGSLGAAYFAGAGDQPVTASGTVETIAPASARGARVEPPSVMSSTPPPVFTPTRPVPGAKTTGRPELAASAAEDDGVDERSEEPTAPTRATARDVAEAPIDPPNDAGLVVPQSGVGTDVVDRQLVGQSETFSVGTRVVFWTRIVGGGYGDSVSHVWLHNGRTTGVVNLPVDGPSWRTQSRRTLATDAEGTWVVEARDSDGRVLARHEFRCES
jgi:cytoskeletal protein RodZ